MAAAAIPIALVAVATAMNAYSAYGQVAAANKARALQLAQVRQQQVQLRLQENQSSIERMKKLRGVLATEEVMFGARGLAPQSSNIRAVVQQNFTNFEQDEAADKLNYLSKQVGLNYQAQSIRDERNARVQQAVIGFGKETVGLAMSLYGMPSGSAVAASGGGASTGAGGASSPFNLNR